MTTKLKKKKILEGWGRFCSSGCGKIEGTKLAEFALAKKRLFEGYGCCYFKRIRITVEEI